MSKAEDPLVDCPLDSVHRIRSSRLQFHLVKCLKNHVLSSSNKVKCPFNPLHIVETVEIMHHCRSCPDSALVILDQYDLEGKKCFSGDISFDELRRQYDASVPENYQCEKYTFNTPGYDPTANIENRPVLRMLSCESKSKRKEFKYRERQRFAALEHNNQLSTKAPPTSPSSQIAKPLRQPHQNSQNAANIVTHTKTAAHKVLIEKNDQVRTQDNEKPSAKKLQISKVEGNFNSLSIKNENKPVDNYIADPKNQSKTSDVCSGILDILNDNVTESLTDALNQLDNLNKAENAIKERKSKLMHLISSTNVAGTQSGNHVDDRKQPQTRINRKCAANFHLPRGNTGGEAAAGSSSRMSFPQIISRMRD